MATRMAPPLADLGLISNKELEAIVGHAIEKKVVFVLLGERLWHRQDGGWYEYPPPEEGS
jgi:hypothetical protein